MITAKYKDQIIEIDEKKKYGTRHLTLTIPVPNFEEIVNRNFPPNTISPIHCSNEECDQFIKVENDKIIVELTYLYETPATSEDIEKEVRKCAQERIQNAKENLKMLCDKYDISMEQLLEMIKDKTE